MTNNKDIITIKNGDAEVSFDRRLFPIIINTWVNAATSALADEYHKVRQPMIEEAARNKTKMVVISDLTRFKAPPSTVRKYLADLAAESDTHEGFYGYVVVVPNPLLRGVVTALTWMTGEKTAPTVFGAEMSDALKKAVAIYHQLGLQPPDIGNPS